MQVNTQPRPDSMQGYSQQNMYNLSNFQPNSFQLQQAHYNQSFAYIASHTIVVDSSWYADSRASSHVTLDLGNFLHYSPYHGNEKLVIGSEEQLDICYIGSAVIQSHTKPITQLKLNKMLHVPHIAKNLLSVLRLTYNNNTIAKYVGNCCVINDKDSKRILLKGTLNDDLYQLFLSGGFF
ncbi:hypothetical protein ACOSQ2_017560 [Xanthoceras sorbifolium]